MVSDKSLTKLKERRKSLKTYVCEWCGAIKQGHHLKKYCNEKHMFKMQVEKARQRKVNKAVRFYNEVLLKK